MILMSLGVPMIFILNSGGYIGFPIMFLSLRELWPQVVQQQLLALIWQVEMEVPMVMESLKVVELHGVVVQGHPLVHRDHCPHLTQLWNSFVSCNEITKGLGLKSY
jgi:hypothetical protein